MTQSNPANRDPLSDAPGAHPVGTGIGAAGGAVTGAAFGAMGGPIGAAVGGVAGAVVGGLAGKGAAEAVNPTVEDAYWRDAYQNEPYYVAGRSYEEYRPAYELAGTRPPRAAMPISMPSTPNGSANGPRAVAPAIWTGIRPGPQRAQPGSAQAFAMSVMTRGPSWHRPTPATSTTTMWPTCSTTCSNPAAMASTAFAPRPRTPTRRTSRPCSCATAPSGAAALELEAEIRKLGREPASGGTVAGALHRGWVSVKTALTSQDDKAVLEECERGEDSAVAQYRKALKQPLPPAIRVMVERQAQGAQRNHDEVRDLRDRMRAAS